MTSKGKTLNTFLHFGLAPKLHLIGRMDANKWIGLDRFFLDVIDKYHPSIMNSRISLL